MVVKGHLGPILHRNFSNDVLRQYVERLMRDGQPVKLAAVHAIQQRRAFHEVIA